MAAAPDAAPAAGDERWSDDVFLDGLRQQADPLADDCVARLAPLLPMQDFRALFRELSRNAAPLPPHTPSALASYLGVATALPGIAGGPADLARIARGQQVFLRNALPACCVLLLKSLIEGYSAPNLSVVLAATGNLEHRTYHRLLGVLQLLVDVSSPGGLEPGGKGLVTLAKVRLIHAAVRRFTASTMPDYAARFGSPLNCEDMLATLMGFSHLILRGLALLRMPLAPEEAQDLYYLWRVAGLAMGIHPAGSPASDAFIPPGPDAASRFYARYCAHHYVGPGANPEGVRLALADVAMLDHLLAPFPFRRQAILLLVEQLAGREAMCRVGLRPARVPWLLSPLLSVLIGAWGEARQGLDGIGGSGRFHAALGSHLLSRLIRMERGGAITFLLPDTLAEFRAL